MLNICCRFFSSPVMSLECGCRSLPSRFHSFLPAAATLICQSETWGGMSLSQNMLSESPCANCRSTAILISLLPSIRRICPSQQVKRCFPHCKDEVVSASANACFCVRVLAGEPTEASCIRA